MSIQRRLECVEGTPVALDPRDCEALRQTAKRLQRELRLRLPAIAEDERGLRVTNLVGVIELGLGTTLHIQPKTRPGDDWIKSILSLLVGNDPVDAAGERAAGLSTARPDLFEALAALYAARLERALHRDGPILVMQREKRISPTLSGKLDVTAWSRRFVTNPTHFPIEINRLSADNDYARALAFVADRFASGVRSAVTRARLARAAGLLRPGLAIQHTPPAGAELRRLPSQWAVYVPAWGIACAVLARRSLLGAEGAHSGISIAIEPWPLLERLLVRSLESVALQSQCAGRLITATGHRDLRLLTISGDGAHRHHYAQPDGMLFKDGMPLATFEAKYRDYSPADGPLRHEVYQALAAARAAGAPVAVLVYPGSFPAAEWFINQPALAPARLLAVGVGMFSYAKGGELSRGKALLDLVEA